jgi:hypothetical protein
MTSDLANLQVVAALGAAQSVGLHIWDGTISVVQPVAVFAMKPVQVP